ncbi:tail assembly protein [Actinobacillus pleuropneumoniae]|nr:tail assembly protein [Actinobacillus pleuropneumoniae]
MQDLSQLDWWLVCNGELHIFPKIQPLIGREFIHGTTDCYSIYKDFYYLAGLDMDEFKRQDYWWEKGENLYLENIEGQGFERLSEDAELQVGDVILMQSWR